MDKGGPPAWGWAWDYTPHNKNPAYYEMRDKRSLSLREEERLKVFQKNIWN
jgi:hypothetical protein